MQAAQTLPSLENPCARKAPGARSPHLKLASSRPEPPMANDIRADLIALLPRLRRFARTLTRSVPEADDLVQDACLRAIDRAAQWDRITRNLWISEIRKRNVRTGTGQVPADESPELISMDTGEAGVAAQQLQQQIMALPGELSSVLLAVSVEGYSYAEAAELFDIPVGTVMSRIHRARKALATQIARAGILEP